MILTILQIIVGTINRVEHSMLTVNIILRICIAESLLTERFGGKVTAKGDSG
jgi:hypothetical protein